MRKKTILTVMLTAVLLIAVTVLTVAAVYRVGAVTLEISTVSEAAKTEAEELNKKLSAQYEKENIFSVDEKQAQKEFENYPHLRMTGFQKSYPNRLIITAVEDPEVYAAASPSGYYILGGDGTLLSTRDTPKNRSDGKDNVLLFGFDFTCERGQIPQDGDFSFTLAFCRVLDERFGGIRSNVLSVTLEKPTSDIADAILNVQTKEGVRFVVYNPSVLTVEKAKSAVAFYLSMPTVDRLEGKINVADTLKCTYNP